MKKTVCKLSLCIFALGICGLLSQKANADALEKSSEGKDALISQSVTSAKDAIKTTKSHMSDSLLEAEADTTSESGVPTFRADNTQMEESKMTEVGGLEEKAMRSTIVYNESQLENAVNSGGTITIGGNFTVRNQLSYRNSFTILGGGFTLTFSGTAGFFSGSEEGATITVSDLTVESSVSYIAPGSTALFSFEGNGTLNLTNFNYTAKAGCPLVSSMNVGMPVSVNLSGNNNLKTTGSGAPDTTLFKDIENMNILGGTTKIADDTPNKNGNNMGEDCYSVIKFWGSSNHKLTIGDKAALDIESSKNILFDVNGKLKVEVGSDANLNYSSRNNRKENQIFGSTGGSFPEGPLQIDVNVGSKTAFTTDGPTANFNGFKVQVNASSPEYFQFESTNNTGAIKKGTQMTFKNVADNTGTSGDYILGETPVSSTIETQTPITVGHSVLLSNGTYQKVIYYKGQSKPNVELNGTAAVATKESVISPALTGSYSDYQKVELFASPKEIDTTTIDSAITTAQNDSTGKSGYYQTATITPDGKLPDIVNVWAGDYYMYFKLSQSSGSATDWIKATDVVPVEEYKMIHRNRFIEFINVFGNTGLLVSQDATLSNYGNTERVLSFKAVAENTPSNVTLVGDTPSNHQKELQLNLQGKNDNSSALWSPLLLNSTSFKDKVILSPFWLGDGKSDVTFTVDGSYSGPLEKNQAEKVSYKVTTDITTNN